MLGPEIKACRESLGLSASGLGQLLGVRTRTIGYWENFESPPPPPGVLEDISRVLSVLENRLLFLRGEMARTQAPVLLVYRTLEDIKQFDLESYRAGVSAEAYRAAAWGERRGRAIRYLEAPEYARWLRATGTPDSLEGRALWAQSFEPINQRNAPGGMRVADGFGD